MNRPNQKTMNRRILTIRHASLLVALFAAAAGAADATAPSTKPADKIT